MLYDTSEPHPRTSTAGGLTIRFRKDLGDLIGAGVPNEEIAPNLDKHHNGHAERDELVPETPVVCPAAAEKVFWAVDDLVPKEMYDLGEDLGHTH